MNNLIKLQLATEALNSLIASTSSMGFTKNSKTLNVLLFQRKQLENFNFKIVDKILNNYAPLLKKRGF